MEYVKENKKEISKGIRFNKTRLNIALSKSEKKSAQQLVDFLIERYVNGENPIMDRQEQANDLTEVHTGSWHEPKQIEIPKPKLNQYQAYYAEIKEARSISAFPAIVAAIKADADLAAQEKVTLEKLAIQESKNDRFL